MTNKETERIDWIDAWVDYIAQADDDDEWGPIHAAIISSELRERREKGFVEHRL